jgi:hypothetical protein
VIKSLKYYRLEDIFGNCFKFFYPKDSVKTARHAIHLPPYYKTWSKVSPGLKLMLSLLFAKRVTVTASVLNQEQV